MGARIPQSLIKFWTASGGILPLNKKITVKIKRAIKRFLFLNFIGYLLTFYHYIPCNIFCL